MNSYSLSHVSIQLQVIHSCLVFQTLPVLYSHDSFQNGFEVFINEEYMIMVIFHVFSAIGKTLLWDQLPKIERNNILWFVPHLCHLNFIFCVNPFFFPERSYIRPNLLNRTLLYLAMLLLLMFLTLTSHIIKLAKEYHCLSICLFSQILFLLVLQVALNVKQKSCGIISIIKT